MTSLKKLTLLLVLILGAEITYSQSLTQTIRGSVIDKISKTALPGAVVSLSSVNPITGTTTDSDGNFKLTKVPVGSHTIKITFIGYKELVLPNILVNSGKEVVLNIPIEEDVTRMDEVVVTSGSNIEKNKPQNDMAVVSARTFSVEETRKFAAAVNDPSRMVTSYAGVVSVNDGNNAISIRGNSPVGLLWRMEGVDIPNPNHFANVGTSGGGISIISSQLLTNSDFMTGAFPAEYGNALSGVFDLNLRKGNNEKREYTVQAGFLGTDIAAEGPFAKKYKGSYLVNYRYSTLSILSKIGANVGNGITNYQDLSYNFYFPTRKAGNFSLFGFGGLSDQNQKAKKDSLNWSDDSDRNGYKYFSNTGAAGLKHAIILNANTYLQSSFVLSANAFGDDESRIDKNYLSQFQSSQHYLNKKLTLSSVLNHKFNARHSMRSGIYLNEYLFNLQGKEKNEVTQNVDVPLHVNGKANTVQLFSQWNYRATEALTVNAGLHYLHMFSNHTSSIEPRASLKYELDDKQSLAFGYGLHGQMQALGIYQADVPQADGSVNKSNANLGFTRAHHWVVGYDRSLTQYLHVKAETYYQYIFNVPVKDDVTSSESMLNNLEGYVHDPLVNKGHGKNYGLELTVEQFFHNDLYFLISSSWYNSKYKALDDVWHDTRFNGKHALAITAGKEYHWEKERTFGLNIRTTFAGGYRYTPIDIEKSIQDQKTEYVESLAFTQKMPDYFRADIRLSLKRNKVKSTRTWSLDVMNATAHQNIGGQYFDLQTAKTKTWNQLGLLPVISYRVEF